MVAKGEGSVLTQKATLVTLSRSSMFFIMANIGILLAEVATMPAAATEFIPKRPLSLPRGPPNNLFIR